MPALKNPRHEAFAQAIVMGIANGHETPFSRGRAYTAAGYIAKGAAADVNASKLLRKAKPIFDRVRELQAQIAEQTGETKEKIIAELNDLRREAKQEKAYGAAVSAVMGKAKILNLDAPQPAPQGFKSAKSMQDIGERLLKSVGLKEPDDASIQAAIKANDRFIAELDAIKARAENTIES